MSSGANAKQARLTRQASVLNELQESQEKDSLEHRCARLMSELSTLCGDRDNVLTPESLSAFAHVGRPEPVTLEREPERPAPSPSDSVGISRGSLRHHRHEDLLNADAGRRQRVEELTRFFMEAKSDIEFALGGSREFREAREMAEERDDDRETDTGDEDDAENAADDKVADPQRARALHHRRLVKEKIDTRVFTPMLRGIRDSDPALYGAVLCHPLVTGQSASKEKKKKKKRKDRREGKTVEASGSGMLSPDFNAEPLSDDEAVANISRFVARAIADGSTQGLLLASKLVLSWVLEDPKRMKEAANIFAVATHLQVLRGEPAPRMPAKKSSATKESGGKSEETGQAEAEEDTDAKSTSDGADGLDADSDSGSLAKLRARLSRFGDDDEDEDSQDDDGGDDDEGHDEIPDEDALMARAIALSLSPEVSLGQSDAKDAGEEQGTSESKAEESAKPRPAASSPEEMLALGPFALPEEDGVNVSGVTVAMCLITQLNQKCLTYLESCRKGVLPSASPIQPHPLTFMLVNSLLTDVTSELAAGRNAPIPSKASATWKLFAACTRISILRVLEAHLFHIEVAGVSPASVGLGRVSSSSSKKANPLLESLKALVQQQMKLSVPEATSDPVGRIVFARPKDCAPEQLEAAADFYLSSVQEQAAAAWVRGIAHFYSSQQDRYHLLTSMLSDCLQTSASGSRTLTKLQFQQLDLLCARLSLPDMAQHFVPSCSITVDAYGNEVFSQKDTTEVVDDSTLQNRALKAGSAEAEWDPSVVEASLADGSLSLRTLFEFIEGNAPGDAVEAMRLDLSSISEEPRSPELLLEAYRKMWEHDRQTEQEALECVRRLPALTDLLRSSLSSGLPHFDWKKDYALVHAPLVPALEKEGAWNARTMLLRALQDLMVQRLGGSKGDEPPALDFDPSRCAETMTLSDDNRTAKQYTAKQWGMSMTTTGCPPNTGVHEWAVHLDRCEKGHVFLGVCTRDASIATYVGGDRHGWGLIGTRALWHNRSKVRGDYGEEFNTGSTVRVRLNTDSGALSFGVDDSDWGIAFDGLTQHGTLYPAIGLYQRDDQVTILPVEQPEEAPVEDGASSSATVVPAVMKPFLHYSGHLLESCTEFLESNEVNDMVSTLSDANDLERLHEATSSHPSLLPLALPLLSSLSLIKNFYGLGSTLAMQFVPWCSKLTQTLDSVTQAVKTLQTSTVDAPSHYDDLSIQVAGEWELKSVAAANIPAQQYRLTLTQNPDGSVFGRSSGSFTSVTLNGIVRGTKICFVETWGQGGTCLVEGRLKSDGSGFSGSYEDAKSRTCGSISGTKVQEEGADKTTVLPYSKSNGLVLLEVVAANLLGYFGSILTKGEKNDLLLSGMKLNAQSTHALASDEVSTSDQDADDDASDDSSDAYEEWICTQLLSGGLPLSSVQSHLKQLLSQAHTLTGLSSDVSLALLETSCKTWESAVTPSSLSAPLPTTGELECTTPGTGLSDHVLQDLIQNRGEAALADQWISKHVGESLVLRRLGEAMKIARRAVCAAMLWHSGYLSLFCKVCGTTPEGGSLLESEMRPHENLMHIWRAAQRVTEWAIRAKNSMGSTYPVVAGLVIRKAEFLLQVEPSAKALAAASAVTALTTADTLQGSAQSAMSSSKSAVYDHAERISSEVLMETSRFLQSSVRVSTLQTRMLRNAARAFLRTMGLLSFRHFVGDAGRGASTKASVKSSLALSTVFQWLTQSTPSRASVLSSSKHSFASVSTREGSTSHYFRGLGGCGKALRSDLREAFEALYGYLSASLSRATWGHDKDLQLTILQSWGVVIEPDDHAFLSRVGIFRVLQRVLDEARAPAAEGEAPAPANDGPEHNFILDSKKKIVQAALKVVHLLAAQVAQAGDASDNLLTSSDLAALPGAAMGSIPLLRKPSGPETLGKSVFHMLFTELKNALLEVQSGADEGREDVAAMEPLDASKDPSVDLSDRSTSGLNDAAEYCYQICSLLYSVSGSPVCRSHLSSSRWLRLLLSLVDVDSTQTRRRVLKLLRRLLPELDPASIRVHVGDIGELEWDSDEDVDVDVDTEEDAASELIRFFIRIIGLKHPPSLAELMLAKAEGVEQSDMETDSPLVLRNTSNVDDLASDVVLLLRSLYKAPKWASYLNEALVKALSTIPREEFGAPTSEDADMETEDKSRETPTLQAYKDRVQTYLNALSSLCVLDGHIEGLHVGATVKIMPRSGSALQEVAFRGAKAVVVSYEPEKSVAEVLLRTRQSADDEKESQQAIAANMLPTRPIRVPIDDLFPVPEIELDVHVFSDQVLESLLVKQVPLFLGEVQKSLEEIQSEDDGNDVHVTADEDSEEDDDMSHDGSSSSPSPGMDMSTEDAVAEDSEAESEMAGTSPRAQGKEDRAQSSADAIGTDPNSILEEADREARLSRMLLCQHGIRAAASFLKDERCASTFIRGVGPAGLIDLLNVAVSETPTAAGISDISTLEESWTVLWSRWQRIRAAYATASDGESKESSTPEQTEEEASGGAPSPMIQQMMEMGFPKEWCEVALARCSHNVEAAINFCFEHSSDMERLLQQHKTLQASRGARSQKKSEAEAISPLLEQLSEMGFPLNWCKKALAANRNNVDAALTWILSNGEALEAEDRREEEAKADGSDDKAAEEEDAAKPEEPLKPNPLRCVSGQASIGERDMMVEGLVGGGFASVGAPDCLVSSGRWYYEATLHTNGCIQIGWADAAFSGAADRGDGVGDGIHSWSYDGWRQQKWHGQSSPWGSKWKNGDVVGCGVDADAGAIIFTLNGKMKSVNMGIAFRAVDFARGLYPCASFNRKEKLQFNLGGSDFTYPPPPGFRPILEAMRTQEQDLPLGFNVIGCRADHLEECIGEESYASDSRYFSRDMHPFLPRGSSSHSRNSGLTTGGSGAKADAVAELRAVPDDRVYMELLLVTRSLAILQARRALLTLLAKWPRDDVGDFTIGSFLRDAQTSVMDGAYSQFLDFVKLLAGLNGHHTYITAPSPPLTLPESDVTHLLDCGATGRCALGLLSSVTRSGIRSALTALAADATGTDVDSASDPLVRVVLESIASEVKRAALRDYARIPWDSSDAAVTASFLQLTAEAGQPWSDKEVLGHPNLFLAEWISNLLTDALTDQEAHVGRKVQVQVRRRLLEAWSEALKSPSMVVKERGATILAGLLQDTLPLEADVVDGDMADVLRSVLDALPMKRLASLSQDRLLKEYANVPVVSKYLQSIVELLSSACLAQKTIGGDLTQVLFDDSATTCAAACKQLEDDLHPLNEAEYRQAEEERAARMMDKADKLQQEEEAKALSAEDARASQDSCMDGTEATNMEIEVSDAEEAPDVTLSSIANMVSEDSDVVAAASAITSARAPATLVRSGKKVESEKSLEELKASFDVMEQALTTDTSMLTEDEEQMLQAAQRGVMGQDHTWKYGNEVGVLSDTQTQMWGGVLTQFKVPVVSDAEAEPELTVGCRVVRGPDWKWRDQDGGDGSVGVVEGVSPWSGVEGEGMSVRWPNDSLYTYRWGADGNYDLVHVDVDEDGNVVKRHPTPRSSSDDTGPFSSELHLGVILHLFSDDTSSSKVSAIFEWPDYNAAAYAVGSKSVDGDLCLQELQLVRGNVDMGWSMRFGTEKWQPGTKFWLHPVKEDESGPVESMAGEFTHEAYRRGQVIQVAGQVQVSRKTLFRLDEHQHHPTLAISDEGMTVTCGGGESRNLVLGTVGFASGVHYWEVRVDQADFGSVFIGVCEKAGPPGSQAALSSRLNRWHGWGFVNFRATFHNSTERIYGDHFNAGDTIGVRLDMDKGKLSFFMDGSKFGEHIVADLGVAFENMKTERASRTLYPCIGMRKAGDRVALNGKWLSKPGVSPRRGLQDALDVGDCLHAWFRACQTDVAGSAVDQEAAAAASTTPVDLPERLLEESYSEWKRWCENKWQRTLIRPRGVLVDLDVSPAACVEVSKAAGLVAPFLAGDRVQMVSKCGREFNQPDEAVVLGVYRGCLWYKMETQGNEGADEGHSWAWYWTSSELAELLLVRRNKKDMTLLENDATDLSEYDLSAAGQAFTPRSEDEAAALADYETFKKLATVGHSTSSDMQLVQRLNMYCAALGVDSANLRISDVMTPEEMTNASEGDARAQSLVSGDNFSTPALKHMSGPCLRARCAVLRVVNAKFQRVLPLLCLRPSDSRVNAIDVTSNSASAKGAVAPVASPAEYLSTSLKLRSLRRLLFSSTKRAFWDDVLRATTTSTPVPSDEYEDPREIRVIRINRIQAQPAKLSLISQPGDRLRRSVFGQLYREMRAWSSNAFRRAYCGKGHGGQRRAFKVKFLGEGVNDYGGPYRAVFEQIVDELQMDNVELTRGEQGLLPLLIPSPNRRGGTGSNQDKFLLNPSCGTALHANGPMALELYRFLGKLVGTAVRHGLQIGMDLPSLVWRPLAGLDVSRAHLESVDSVTGNILQSVEDVSNGKGSEEDVAMLEHLTFATHLSDGTEVPLCPNGESTPVAEDNAAAFVRLAEKARLTESVQQLSALKEGLGAVLPMELAPLFTPQELEVLICGRRDVDVDLLQQCTEYGDGVDESMTHVQTFWEVLREMSSEERTSFLRFVWARSRMPNSAKDFPMNFKIQSAHDAAKDPDKYLPHAQTCFFALRLPQYTTKAALRQKLLYAIQNSPNMDADVRLHNAEGWADA